MKVIESDKKVDNKLMNAALVLYRHIHDQEVSDFMNCIADDFNTKHYRKRKIASSAIFAWGINRWGLDYSYAEYRERETGILTKEYFPEKIFKIQ